MPEFLLTPIARAILTRVLPAALLVGAVGCAVYRIDHNGYLRAETLYKGLIAVADRAAADAKLAAQAAAQKKYEAEAKRAFRLSVSLADANIVIDKQERQLTERAKNVSTTYRIAPSAPLLPVPGWIVTNGWVCDYNRAIGYGLSPTGSGPSGDESPSCSSDAFGPSGVSAERILQHHEEYGAYVRKLEQQVNRLIDHLEFIESEAE